MGITITTQNKTALSVTEIISKVLFMIVGVAIIIGGIIVYPQINGGTYQQTKAVISKMELNSGSVDDDDADYLVYVDYSVAGRSYHKIQLNAYSSGWKEGKTVKIEYNIDDPADIRTPFTRYIPYIVMAVGAVFVGVGIYGLIRKSIVIALGSSNAE